MRSGVLSAVDKKMLYPDQASSFLEFAETFKGLQSPNTLLRRMHCKLFLVLYFQRENFEE